MKLNARVALPSRVHPSLCGMIEPKSPTAKIASRQVVNLALARRAFVSSCAARRSIRTRLCSRAGDLRDGVDSVSGFIVPLTILGV